MDTHSSYKELEMNQTRAKRGLSRESKSRLHQQRGRKFCISDAETQICRQPCYVEIWEPVIQIR